MGFYTLVGTDRRFLTFSIRKSHRWDNGELIDCGWPLMVWTVNNSPHHRIRQAFYSLESPF